MRGGVCGERKGGQGEENIWKVKKFVTSARKRGMCEFTARIGGKTEW